MSMVNATEELRMLLDERGIEWWSDDDLGQDHTEWVTDDAVFTSLGMDDGELAVQVICTMTPEEVVDMTVKSSDRDGSDDTCRMRVTHTYSSRDNYVIYACSECGVYVFRTLVDSFGNGKPYSIPPKYCPECGRRVVE